jgi:hypothetical protein
MITEKNAMIKKGYAITDNHGNAFLFFSIPGLSSGQNAGNECISKVDGFS